MKKVLALLAFVTSALAQPSVTAVLDGAAFTNDLAQGSVFVVRGTGLSGAGMVSAPAPSYPKTLNSISMTLTSVTGGTVVTPYIANTFNGTGMNQVVAVLPSDAAPGPYDLRLTNGSATSSPFRTNVVVRKPGIVTASSDGTGTAQATLSGQLILQRTTNQGKIGEFDTRSAHPSEGVSLWGTGLGADLAADTGGTSGNQTSAGQIFVLVNGVEIVPAYAGRSGVYPGLDQIVFFFPADVALNCQVDVQVRAGTVFSNPVTIATSTGDNCPTSPTLRINEVESSGGVPGDWVEIYNTGTTAVSTAGLTFKDNDNTHNYALPTVSIPPGGYYLLEEADFGFGLGSPDAARLYRADGTLADAYFWTPHSTVTYGRCPNGSGPLVTTTAVTKGAANACGTPVRINEVESDSGTPGDWVELFNPAAAPADISGYTFRDNDDTHSYIIPAGSTIPAGGYFLLDEAAFGFGLGSADSARLFDKSGALVDSYTWTAHATTTYGRCPNGSGDFTTTTASTKGTANACPAPVSFVTWPGSATIQTVDVAGTFGTNLSGLIYEGSGNSTPGVLWGVKNGPSTLYRLTFDGTNWVPDTANNWVSGKALRYSNGTGDPDAEGVTFTTGPSAGIYVSTERDNNVSGTSRPTILRFDPSASGATLNATQEWNLTADLPVVGANLGIEGITWIPDTYLVSKGFQDENKNHPYTPSEYPNHGSGIFFVGLEANGMVYGYALDQAGTTFTRVATIATGFPAVMDLQYDRDTNDFWAVCDDTCQGRTAVLRIGTNGKFAVARQYERPAGMPNLNNEGFAIAPPTYCNAATNTRPVFWADDTGDDGHAIRAGTLTCSPL